LSRFFASIILGGKFDPPWVPMRPSGRNSYWHCRRVAAPGVRAQPSGRRANNLHDIGTHARKTANGYTLEGDKSVVLQRRFRHQIDRFRAH